MRRRGLCVAPLLHRGRGHVHWQPGRGGLLRLRRRYSIQGLGGNDILDGGDGTDILDGGDGIDRCERGETVSNWEP